MATAAFLPSRYDKARHDIPNFVLLDLWGPIASRRNATTATSKTSTGVPISVTFCAASPPALSHLSVDCPDLELDRTDLSLAPKVLSTDSDLVLLRVPISPLARYDERFSDYFVYRVQSQLAKLDLLPSPDVDSFGLGDDEIAILSCGGDKYAVAALEPLFEVAFRLHLYRSGPDGKAGSWTSQRVFVEKPLRDAVCPIPESAQRIIYHETTKVITLGGAKGTVGWVDLWRGILLCDVLEESPKLRDMPLPLPSMGNWSKFLNECPYYSHDIIVNQSKDTIKYTEMEKTSWSWKVTIWTMPIPVTSWDDWRYQCSVRSEDINPPADIRMHFKLLHKFHSDDKEVKVTERALSLGSLHMAYPTLSIADDDVVYLLSEGINTGAMKMIFAVDVRAGTLQGMVKHDAKRHIGFMRCHFSSGISKHLKASGREESLRQTEVDDASVCNQESKAPFGRAPCVGGVGAGAGEDAFSSSACLQQNSSALSHPCQQERMRTGAFGTAPAPSLVERLAEQPAELGQTGPKFA